MELGKLYQIKKHFWLLYPSKDIAALATPVRRTAASAADYSDYWSERFKCNVSYIPPNTILFPVEIEGKFVKVISTEGIGWMIVEDWAKECVEEVKEE